MSQIQDSVVERFEQNIFPEPNSGCWIWTAHWRADGYGHFRMGGLQWLAHRASWLIYRGEIDHHLVLHKCDNRHCVNPDHLYLGSYSDNFRDHMNRGDYTPLAKERNGRAKLTAAQVEEIRRSKENIVQCGKRYGVSNQMISRIRRRIAWK